MREPSVLSLYDPEPPLELHTDASAVGLAGMLLQPDAGGKLRLVRCVSRKCSDAETSYHSSKLELLAITYALDKFRTYLIGRQFKLVTDCQALLSINTGSTRNPQMARWCALIQEFRFSVEHRAGARMSHVDALSRNPVSEAPTASEKIYCRITSERGSGVDESSFEDLIDGNSEQGEVIPHTSPLTYEADIRAV